MGKGIGVKIRRLTSRRIVNGRVSSQIVSMSPLARHLEPRRSAPRKLPLVHVTPMSRFRQIADCGRLVPQPCPVLRREILYCSYADVVFRPSREETSWDSDPAVALLLSPDILDAAFTFAPLDTGAIASGRVPWFPNSARGSLGEQYCVADRGGELLGAWMAEVYGDEAGYAARRVRPTAHDAPDELLVARQLAEAAVDLQLPDHTRDDMRVMSQIECHLSRPVELKRSLLAAFLPAYANLEFLPEIFGAITHAYQGSSIGGNLPADLVHLVRHRIEPGDHARVH